jgi:sulfatase modifying factor 1
MLHRRYSIDLAFLASFALGSACGSERPPSVIDAMPDASVDTMPVADVAPSGVRDQSCSRSAAGSASGCGSTDESCCVALAVPGGTFEFAAASTEFGLIGATATVSSFSLEKYEVTVGRFRGFVEALDTWKPNPGDGAHRAVPGSGWVGTWPLGTTQVVRNELLGCGGTWTDETGPNETKPITCLTWFELAAFCIWDGGRIPTMVERTYVAHGGTDNRDYPWSEPGVVDAGVEDGRATYSPEGGAERTAPEAVGTNPAGAGKWGQLDLSGGAAEWVLDRYPPDPFPNKGNGGCTDCALIGTATQERVHHGGSFASGDRDLHSWAIGYAIPSARQRTIGGRCVK